MNHDEQKWTTLLGGIWRVFVSSVTGLIENHSKAQQLLNLVMVIAIIGLAIQIKTIRDEQFQRTKNVRAAGSIDGLNLQLEAVRAQLKALKDAQSPRDERSDSDPGSSQ